MMVKRVPSHSHSQEFAVFFRQSIGGRGPEASGTTCALPCRGYIWGYICHISYYLIDNIVFISLCESLSSAILESIIYVEHRSVNKSKA